MIEPIISKACIHCTKCTKNCTFLSKYANEYEVKFDLMEFEKNPQLAYNCFLCGKCKIVCPKNIDGRNIALSARRKEVDLNKGKMLQKGYSSVIIEKANYLFRNYKNVNKSKVAVFTGCNFPSYLPSETHKIIETLKAYEIGAIFDCCGKPVSELGLEDKENKLLNRLKENLRKNGIEELILLCPNCYYYLKDKLDIKMVDIYTKLRELGIGKKIADENVLMFRPCPDRESNEIEEKVAYFIEGSLKNVNEQCCGAGGCAGVKERELAKGFREDIKSQVKDSKLYTYCATCTGFFKTENVNIHHVLEEILNVHEEKVGNSWLNRLKSKFYKSR